MKANVIFSNVKAYDISKMDVLLGQTFKIELVDFNDELVRWFSDNDQVLSINVSKDTSHGAQFNADAVGVTEIQLQVNQKVVKTLFIEVFDNVTVSLGLQAEEPILK